jgi:hypothetical protein
MDGWFQITSDTYISHQLVSAKGPVPPAGASRRFLLPARLGSLIAAQPDARDRCAVDQILSPRAFAGILSWTRALRTVEEAASAFQLQLNALRVLGSCHDPNADPKHSRYCSSQRAVGRGLGSAHFGGG